MIYNNVRTLVLDEKSFSSDVNEVKDINISNLTQDAWKQYLRAQIVIYHVNGNTVIMKNSFGNEGMVIPI